jgi:hypothetical protein
MYKKSDNHKANIKKVLGRVLSPAFLIILLTSFLLWYMAKLSHEYTAEMPLNIRIDGQKYRVTAVVNGRGSLLTAHQLSLKKVNIRSEELAMRPSEEASGAFTITETSLQKALTNRLGNVKIVQIVEIPDFIPETK